MKNKVLFAIMCSMFILIFNISFFLLKSNTVYAATWISYSFIHVAYIGVVITQFLESKNEEVVLSLSSHLLSVIFFTVEFVVGLIFIIVNPIGFKAALIIQLIIFGMYVISLIMNLISNSKIERDLEKSKNNRDYIKGTIAVLNSIKASVIDDHVSSLINKLYDIVHGSQLKSNSEAVVIENEIKNRVMIFEKQLTKISVEAQILELEELIDLANKRNIIVKRYN